VNITLLGTRGSIASPGPDTVRYGGNTSCVEVRNDAGELLVLDAGTGIRRLRIRHDTRRVDVLLTHLHMDHLQGLGFFAALRQPDLEVHLWGPASATLDLFTRLTRYLSPPLFPVRLRDLECDLHVHDVSPENIDIPGFAVTAATICHPGPTVGYRIRADQATLAYLPDHEPMLCTRSFTAGTDWISGLALATDTDVLIHDSQYTAEEYEHRVGWGHSTIEHAAAFAAAAHARHLVPFHHDPSHDDDTLDRLHAQLSPTLLAGCRLVPLSEGDTLPIEPASTGGTTFVGR
jgi:phosphoribosyl 1,2-cyclic phosphodiesterase